MLLLATGCVVAVAGIGAGALGLPSRSDTATAAALSGLTLVTVLTAGLGVARALRPWAVTVAAAGCLAVAGGWLLVSPAARERLGAAARDFRVRPAWPRGAVAWVAAVAGAAAAGEYAYRAWLAVRLPPVAADAVYYHLLSVSEWVRTGSLDRPVRGLAGGFGPGSSTFHLYSVTPADAYPKDTELVAAWFATFTHDVSLTGLTQFGFGLLLVLAVYGLCRRLAVPPALAALAATAVALAPVVVVQVGTLYVDVARVAGPVAAWQFLLAAFPKADDAEPAPPRGRLLALAGLGLALGVGVKTTNLYFVPPAALIVGWYAVRRRAGTVRCLLALLVPVAVLGSFWYLRSWWWWGSPFWPVRAGPFHGVTSQADLVECPGKCWLPPSWRHRSDGELMLRSWALALKAYRGPTGFEQRRGGLGLAWLLVMLPALGLCAATARRHARAVVAVLLPVVVVTLIPHGRWSARYTLPLLVAGAVAVAVFAGSARHRAIPPLAALALAATTCWSAFCVTARPSTSLHDGRGDTFAASLRDAALPAGKRRLLGRWGPYAPLQRALPAGAPIAYCVSDIPIATLTLVGQDFRHSLRQLGSCPDPSTAARRLRATHTRYLYTMTGFALDQQLTAAGRAAGFRQLFGYSLDRVWVLEGP
ncbi:MAG: hypothetical protein ACJ73S_26870 [Mycobacteriales bacterium]